MYPQVDDTHRALPYTAESNITHQQRRSSQERNRQMSLFNKENRKPAPQHSPLQGKDFDELSEDQLEGISGGLKDSLGFTVMPTFTGNRDQRMQKELDWKAAHKTL